MLRIRQHLEYADLEEKLEVARDDAQHAIADVARARQSEAETLRDEGTLEEKLAAERRERARLSDDSAELKHLEDEHAREHTETLREMQWLSCQQIGLAAFLLVCLSAVLLILHKYRDLVVEEDRFRPTRAPLLADMVAADAQRRLTPRPSPRHCADDGVASHSDTPSDLVVVEA